MRIRNWFYGVAVIGLSVLPALVRAGDDGCCCQKGAAAKCDALAARAYPVADLVTPVAGLPDNRLIPMGCSEGPCVP